MELSGNEEEMTLSVTSETDFCTTLTAPEFILSKTEHWAKTGKTIWAADFLSGETREYRYFEENTRSIASWFQKNGMEIRDTLLYMSKDLINLHLLMTGVWRANGIIRSTYPEDTEETILNCVLTSRAKWIVCDEGKLGVVQSVKKKVTSWGLEIIVFGQGKESEQPTACISMKNLLADTGDECPELKIKPEDIALVLPTSGTTGNSKGVALSHFAMISLIEMYTSEIPWTDSMNFFLCKSIHISGSTYPFSCLCSGKPSLFITEITTENLKAAVEKYKPGSLFGLAPYITTLANSSHTIDTTSVQNVFTGGVATGPSFPNKTLRQFPNFKKLIIVYGMTEANVLTFHHVDLDRILSNDTQPLSVGKVAPYTRIQFRNTETGKLCGPNQQGELCAKTSNMFTSYIGLPEETKATFVDGWIRTGDLGYYDEEGYIYINGRIKEMFKSFGSQISPSEIDEIISRHPDVASVCTIGIPDPVGGDKIPRAYVTLKPGCITSANEIMEFAHGFLASYKHLKGGVFVVPELPRGSSGKIPRALVEKTFLTNVN